MGVELAELRGGEVTAGFEAEKVGAGLGVEVGVEGAGRLVDGGDELIGDEAA